MTPRTRNQLIGRLDEGLEEAGRGLRSAAALAALEELAAGKGAAARRAKSLARCGLADGPPAPLAITLELLAADPSVRG